jgi:hypothetical protein
VVLLAVALEASVAHADELPAALQVQLLSKMSTYVANFAPAGATAVKVLVVHPGSREAPSRGALALANAITQAGQLGTFTAQAVLVPLADPRKLQATLAAEKPQVIYLAPELDEKGTTEIVEAALSGTALTISGVSEHLRLGVVLGFALVEARPRVLINLKQAQKQNIVFLGGLVSHSVVVDR